jgi:hypothetical protein
MCRFIILWLSMLEGNFCKTTPNIQLQLPYEQQQTKTCSLRFIICVMNLV